MSDNLPAEERFHVCPDCRCQFVQPFVCATCGAEKLYDATVRSQASAIENLMQRLRRINAINDDPARFDKEIDELSNVEQTP